MGTKLSTNEKLIDSNDGSSSNMRKMFGGQPQVRQTDNEKTQPEDSQQQLPCQSPEKEVTVKSIAFNLFSRTLETSRKVSPLGTVVDIDALGSVVDGSEVGKAEQSLPLTRSVPLPAQSETRRKGQKPQLTVIVSTSNKEELDDSVCEPAPVIVEPRDGKEGGLTPRTPSLLSPGGGLHVGAFTINTSGTTIRTPLGRRPSSFLRDGVADFIEIQTLGRGASGRVCEALHLPTLTLVALKMLPICDTDNMHHLANELAVLQQNLAELKLVDDSLSHGQGVSGLDVRSGDSAQESGRRVQGLEQGTASETPRRKSSVHSSCPHILAMYDAFLDAGSGFVNLAVEFMDGGSLQDVVDHGGCDCEEVLADIAHRMLLGLDFLHRQNVAHRDIKPGNVLISCAGSVKLADFGLSKDLSSALAITDDKASCKNQHSFVGTLSYMAPERISNRMYGLPADVWSFGLTLLAVLVGHLPLAGSLEAPHRGYWELLSVICDEDVPIPEEKLSPPLVRLLSECLQKRPDDRSSASSLLSHEFFSEYSTSLCWSLVDFPPHATKTSLRNQKSRELSVNVIRMLSMGGDSDVEGSDHDNPSLPLDGVSAPVKSCSSNCAPLFPSPRLQQSTNTSESLDKKAAFLAGDHSSWSSASPQSLSSLANRTSFHRSMQSNKSVRGGEEMDCSVHSDLSSDVDFFADDEDSQLAASRLEHLERILVRVNAKLEKDTGSNCDSCTVAAKLPSVKRGAAKWRHLAQQLFLPPRLVVSLARTTIRSDFFLPDK